MTTQTTDKPTLVLVETPQLAQWVDGFIRARKAEGFTAGTLRFYGEKLPRFVAWCDLRNVTAPDEVTAEVVRDFMLHLEEQGNNAGGRRAYFKAIKTFLRWWVSEVDPDNWKDPFKRVKPPKLPTELLEPVDVETVKALLEATETRMGARNRAILLTLFDTGLRASELTALDLEDFNPVTGDLRVRCGKGQKERMVFAGQKARRAIRAYLKERGQTAGPLFPAEHGGALSYKGLREVVQLAAKRAHVAPPPLHAFRRAFALNCLRAGMDLLSLQRLLGHAGLAVLQRYVKQTPEDLKAAHNAASPVDKAGL